MAKQVLRKGTREFQEEYADWEFPPKPKWMRWKTYNRLDEKAQGYDQAADAVFLWRIRKLLLPRESLDGLIKRVCGDEA